MGIPLEQYKIIQDYLDGSMTSQEEKDFLFQTENNTLLKEAFEFEKELRENLNSILDKKNLFEKESTYHESNKSFKDNDPIKNLIKKAGSEWEEENKQILDPVSENIIHIKTRQQKRNAINLQRWVITAAACIVIAIISLVWLMQKPPSPELVKTNENPVIGKHAITDTARTIPNDTIKNINPHIHKVNYAALFKKYYAKDTATQMMPELLSMMPDKYKNGDYSFQEINLNKIPVTRGSSNDINSRENILQLGHYYQGLSYIETNDDKKAIEKLQWVIENANNEKIKVKAQWYVALIYLKDNQNKKAIPLLLSLSKNGTGNSYNKKARDILLAIENPN